jgi:hypothetical protein
MGQPACKTFEKQEVFQERAMDGESVFSQTLKRRILFLAQEAQCLRSDSYLS